MARKAYIDAFDPEGKSQSVCENCGLCLQQCPVMKMEKAESQAEMSRLLKGQETERVVNECTFCFSCNHYCPQGLRPYALIMQRAAEMNSRTGKGFPPYMDYLLTGKTDSCLFWDVYAIESAEEKAILDRWELVPPKSPEVLFIGCIGREIPYGTEHSRVFEGLPKYSPRSACCGELAYRYGDYQAFAETVERTREMLKASIRNDWFVTAAPARIIWELSGRIIMVSNCPLRSYRCGSGFGRSTGTAKSRLNAPSTVR